MRYTKNKPETPGWYWYVELGELRTNGTIVHVFMRPGHNYLCVQVEPQGFATKRDFRPVHRMHGDWAGPIVEPQPLYSTQDSEEHF